MHPGTFRKFSSFCLLSISFLNLLLDHQPTVQFCQGTKLNELHFPTDSLLTVCLLTDSITCGASGLPLTGQTNCRDLSGQEAADLSVLTQSAVVPPDISQLVCAQSVPEQ